MDEQNQVDPNLMSIAQAVSRIEQGQEDLKRELLGNGQPGRIQMIEASVTKNRAVIDCQLDKHDTELDGLHKKYWIFTGVIVAASHGVKGIWPYIVKFFTS